MKSIAGGLIEKEVIAQLGAVFGSPEFIRLAANDAGCEESEGIDSRAFVWRELLASGTYTEKTKLAEDLGICRQNLRQILYLPEFRRGQPP